MQFNHFARGAVALAIAGFSLGLAAAPGGNGGGNGGGGGGPTVPEWVSPCTLDSVRITAAAPSNLAPNPVALPGALSATSCYGVMSGNDGPLESADPNLGYLEDGLLNGGSFKGSQYVPPYQFLTMVGGDVPQDLDGDGQADDPGWVFLGGMQGFNGELDYAQSFNGGNTLNMADVIKFTMSSTDGSGGSWRLDVAPNVKDVLEAAGIFNRSSFDHLAFVIKSGNEKSGGGWAVYDFNFNLLAGFDLSQPYRLSGDWNTDDFGGHAISHISIWARDPITGGEVPVPGTLLLVGMGLLALYGCRFKAQRL